MAKILIVEDNALNIKLFCDLLAAHGHQPEAVADSRLAMDAARNFSPDLVITDIQLPHVSGLELIRMLRADAQLELQELAGHRWWSLDEILASDDLFVGERIGVHRLRRPVGGEGLGVVIGKLH